MLREQLELLFFHTQENPELDVEFIHEHAKCVLQWTSYLMEDVHSESALTTILQDSDISNDHLN